MIADKVLTLPANRLQELESQILALSERVAWLERVLGDDKVQRTLMLEQRFGKPNQGDQYPVHHLHT